MRVARRMRISPIKVVVAGALLAVALATLVLKLVAAEKPIAQRAILEGRVGYSINPSPSFRPNFAEFAMLGTLANTPFGGYIAPLDHAIVTIVS